MKVCNGFIGTLSMTAIAMTAAATVVGTTQDSSILNLQNQTPPYKPETITKYVPGSAAGTHEPLGDSTSMQRLMATWKNNGTTATPTMTLLSTGAPASAAVARNVSVEQLAITTFKINVTGYDPIGFQLQGNWAVDFPSRGVESGSMFCVYEVPSVVSHLVQDHILLPTEIALAVEMQIPSTCTLFTEVPASNATLPIAFPVDLNFNLKTTVNGPHIDTIDTLDIYIKGALVPATGDVIYGNALVYSQV